MKRKTSSRHFKVFKEEAERCAALWGIDDIKLYFHHGVRDSRASFNGRHTKRVATLTLSKTWEDIEPGCNEPITDDEVRETARHEVVHALLLPLGCLPGTYCTSDEAEEAEERIVQRLMRILPKPGKTRSSVK